MTELVRPLLFPSVNRALFPPARRDEVQAQMAIAEINQAFKTLGDHFAVAVLNVATAIDLAAKCGSALDAWRQL